MAKTAKKKTAKQQPKQQPKKKVAKKSQTAKKTNKQPPKRRRSDEAFLLVVDNTEEMDKAVVYACRRARHTGNHIVLLYVIEPADFHHWLAVSDMMSQEARDEARETLSEVTDTVVAETGQLPGVYIREGNVVDEINDLLERDKNIVTVVLGAASGGEGPGPVVSALLKKGGDELRVPITVVPGHLNKKQIREVS